MARAAVKAKQAQRAKAAPPKSRAHGRRRHSGGGNPNQQLFFTRLRRQAKWVYVLLAVLFAATFAFLGVGSGQNSGLDQLFSGLNIFSGGGGKSVASAQKEIQKHPNDPKGYRDLATAYEAKGDTGNAISALQQYTVHKPKDAKVWSELAGLQTTQAQTAYNDYVNAYQAQQLAAPSASFLPTGTLGTAIGSNPIESAQSAQAQGAVTELQSKVQLAYNGAVNSWQQLSKLRPKDANTWFQLGEAAQTAGDTTTAVKAYTHYLKIDPSSANAGQIKQLIKQLSAPTH
jgi:tetratricopeptide (TPR) repeat protein